MTTLEIYKNIIKRIAITPEKVILLDGKPYNEAMQNSYTSIPSNKMLFDMMQALLYNEFYAASEKLPIQTMEDYIKIEEETKLFNEYLSKFNSNKEKMDSDWAIEQIDTYGNIYATKGNLKRQIFAGEFINESAFGRVASQNENVKIIMRKEYKSTQNGFYFIFSNTCGEDNQDMLVRFYFNINKDGVHLLVKNISEQFNNYSIPFSFKCANHPQYYSRKDTAVLYIEKKYTRIATQLIDQIYSTIAPFMQNDIPAFTKKLYTGIAFAENPYKQDESFGTHCCKMITQAILGAYHKNIQKDKWLDVIKHTLEKIHQYKDFTLLYTNPQSYYPYNFSQSKN
jgi:hypothetical protein